MNYTGRGGRSKKKLYARFVHVALLRASVDHTSYIHPTGDGAQRKGSCHLFEAADVSCDSCVPDTAFPGQPFRRCINMISLVMPKHYLFSEVILS